MTAVFADASFYVALSNRRDQDHAAALALAKSLAGPVITTEYVLIEVGNWLAGAGYRDSFIRLVDDVAADHETTVISATPELFRAGVLLYRQRADKDWGLTDCISFALMRDHGLHDALTADTHFRQAGFRALMLDGQ